jgi:glycosyltransferase involved in cell wall biosynthesis
MIETKTEILHIIEFLSDPEPWRQMARRGRDIVETHFNFQTRTRKLEAIYAELAEGA